jgi:hypothetical protein
MKQRVEEMEREAKKLRELQAAAESSVNVEQVEGEEAMPMETEDEKALIDNRSVFVGNVRDSSSLVGITTDCLTFRRLTTARRPKISRHTFKPVVPSTVSPSSVTSSQAILKGTQLPSIFFHNMLTAAPTDLLMLSLQNPTSSTLP